jgi:hypothetical protein
MEVRRMELVSRGELNALLRQSEFPCVSLYMPTHAAGSDNRQDPIRYKNLLRRCEDMLAAEGVRGRDAQEMLSRPRQLLEDAPFWRNQSDALALFIGPRIYRFYRVPLETEEILTVSRRFHVKPLLPLFSRNGLFYVLALSQKNVRLLQCTRYSAREVGLPDVPTSIDEALAGTVFEKAQQFHTGTPAREGSDRAAVFHTQGTGHDDSVKKKYVVEFLRLVRDGVMRQLEDRHDPLVLAGVQAEQAMYREIDRYADTLSEGVDGNPDLLSGEQLRERAWEVVEPAFRRQEADAIAAYEQAQHTVRAARDVHKVVPAAYEGRVQTLLVTLGEQLWGTYLPEGGRAEVHDTRQPGDDDLLDFAAAHALMHGGGVHALSKEDMPDGASLAAVFRY